MKRSDILMLLYLALLFVPFFISDELYAFYGHANSRFPYLLSFIKFALLAPAGELIGLRIRKGVYHEDGFGLIPRAFVWGLLGLCIKAAFVIFGEGAPNLLASLGIHFSQNDPSEVLRQPGFSGGKLMVAAGVSITMNLFFAPMLMITHRITDIHILRTGGTMQGFLSAFNMNEIVSGIDWKVMWNFVFKKTILLFWIPAHTLNFMFPEEWRVLFAAILGIVLGVLLAITSLKTTWK